MSDPFSEKRIEDRERRKEKLIQELDAVNRQWARELDEANRLRLDRQSKDLETEVQNLEDQIRQLGPDQPTPAAPAPKSVQFPTKLAVLEPGALVLDYQALLRACAEHLDMQLRDLAAKYNPNLYVHRDRLEKEFGGFVTQPDKSCFLVLGRSGNGKTNSLCYLAHKHSEHTPVIFLKGSIRVNRANAILERAAEIVGIGIGQRIDVVGMLKAIDACVSANKTHLLIFIDGINETRDTDTLKEELRTTLQMCSGTRIRFCLSCRDQFWSYFDDDFWPNYVYDQGHPESELDAKAGKGSKSDEKSLENALSEAGQLTTTRSVSLGAQLEDFSETEMDAAEEKYFATYEVEADLVARARQRCRHPLLLRIFSEANQGQSLGIMDEVGHLGLIERYWQFKANSIRKQLHQPTPRTAESVILAIAAMMLARGSPLLDEEDMQQVAFEQGTSLDDSMFVVLGDEGVLFQDVVSPTTGGCQFGFCYDEFLEYSLARHLFAQHNWRAAPRREVLEDFLGYGKRMKEFYNLIGALEYAVLMLEQERTSDDFHLEVLDKLSQTSVPWQWMVTRCIAKLEHPTDQRCYALLRELIQRPKAVVRENAARALGVLGRRDAQASLKTVEDLAYNGAVFGRDVLAFALNELVAVDQENSLKLLRLLSQDREPYVRRVVAWTLSDIVETAPDESMELLGELASDDDWWVRKAAADSASDTMRVDFSNSMAILGDLCCDERTYVRWAAAHSLAEAANVDSDELLEVLQGWITDSDPKLREAATLALKYLPTERPEKALVLIRGLAQDEDAEVREATAYCLDPALGPEHVRELLLGLASDSDHEVRWAVARILENLDSESAVKVIEVLVQRPLRFTLHEILTFTWKWLRKSVRALLDRSAKDLIIDTHEIYDGLLRLANIEYHSVQTRVVRSLRHSASDVEQGTRILCALTDHKSVKIRMLAAQALAKMVPELPSGRQLLNRLARDSNTRVSTAARKGFVDIGRRAKLRKKRVLDVITAGLLAVTMLSVLYRLMPPHYLHENFGSGSVGIAAVTALALTLLVSFGILGVLRFQDGFGRRSKVIGLIGGSGVATGLLLVEVSPWQAAVSLLVVALIFSLYYDYKHFFDGKLYKFLGYYVVFGCVLALMTLFVTAGWYSILTSDWVLPITLGALSGILIGMLRSIEECFFWRVSIYALLGLAVGAVIAGIMYLLEMSFHSLPKLRSWLWTDSLHLIGAGLVLGALVTGLGVAVYSAVWGERYRGILKYALLGGTLGCSLGLVSRHSSLILLGTVVGLASGGLLGIAAVSLKYKWYSTLKWAGIWISAGAVVGVLTSLWIDGSAALTDYLLAGMLSGYITLIPAGLALFVFRFWPNEFSRLD